MTPAALSPTCDHHDLPLVCGECGRHMSPPPWFGRWHVGKPTHLAQPVHLLVDPEGFEGTQRIPCGLA